MGDEDGTLKKIHPKRIVAPLGGLILLVIVFFVFNSKSPENETGVASPTLEQALLNATETQTEMPLDSPVEPSEPMVGVLTDASSVNPSGQKVVFWHVWYSDPAKSGMDALVNEFNAINEWGITVEALDQGSYGDVEDLINAGARSGDLPDLVVGYPFTLASWYSLGILTDLNDFLSHPSWGFLRDDIEDFFEVPFNVAEAAEGYRFGLAISQSLEVLFYNQTWGQELGFEGPPSTPQEFKEQACAAMEANATDEDPDNDGTGGYVLYPGASLASAWAFAYGGTHLSADSSVYQFATPEWEATVEFLKDLWDEGCAFSTEEYPNPEFATRKALLISSSSIGLSYQLKAFRESEFKDEWVIIPFPGQDRLVVNAYLQSVGIVKSTPEQELATWLFLKWFLTLEQQTKWAQTSGYYPIRASTLPLLDTYAGENPQWASGLELLSCSFVETDITSWASVRGLLQDYFSEMIFGPAALIPDLLEELDEAAAEMMEEMP
jgi:multiple sugar transport system substrate-binding protein